MRKLFYCLSSIISSMIFLVTFLMLFNSPKNTYSAPWLADKIYPHYSQNFQTGQINLMDDPGTTDNTIIITVTTTSDALNGDCSSVVALLINPGLDGVSLREAITASNNTPGPEKIIFAEELAGATILVGETVPDALPILIGGGLTINGDINHDGTPDVTLDGSLGNPNSPLANCLSIWSDNNTVKSLNIIGFSQAIQFGVPNFWLGPSKTISGNQILNNTISSTLGIFIGPLGWIEAYETEQLSNLTWQHTLITDNHISATQAIFMYAGAGAGQNNQIMTTTVSANHIYAGGDIGLLAGDTNTRYHSSPGSIQYSDNNRVENVSIENNVLEDVTYTAITVAAANMGNQGNQIRDVHVVSNTIMGAVAGVMVLGAGEAEPAYRDTISNTVSDVTIDGNYIQDTWYGIISGAGGHAFVRQSSCGINENRLENVVISNNKVFRSRWSGIIAWGGMMNGTTQAMNNELRQISIFGNQLISQTESGGAGIQITGGWSNDGTVLSNTISFLDIDNNYVAGFDYGISVFGGNGLGAEHNFVQGSQEGNNLEATAQPVRIMDDFFNATNNFINWEQQFGIVDGTVYIDEDRNGVYSTGTDTPLSGVDVHVKDIYGVWYSLITSSSGYFSQTMPAGETFVDVVEVDLPSGLILASGSTDPTMVYVPAAGTVTDNTGYVWDQSEIYTGFVEGLVYLDEDRDGSYTSGTDSPLHNVDVMVKNKYGLTYTLTTDPSGFFSQIVPAGETEVDVDDTELPSGLILASGSTDPTIVNVPAGGTATVNTGYIWGPLSSVYLPVIMNLPDYHPMIAVLIENNCILGFHWLTGSQIGMSIDNPDTPENPDFIDTQPVEIEGRSTKVSFCPGEDFIIQPGDIITMANDIRTVHHVVTNLTVEYSDLSSDTIWGKADKAWPVEIFLSSDMTVIRWELVDQMGGWAADFSSPGDDLGEEKIHDIIAGDKFILLQWNGDGQTQLEWQAP